MIWSETI